VGRKKLSCRHGEHDQSGHLWYDQRALTGAGTPRPRPLSVDGEAAQLQRRTGASGPAPGATKFAPTVIHATPAPHLNGCHFSVLLSCSRSNQAETDTPGHVLVGSGSAIVSHREQSTVLTTTMTTVRLPDARAYTTMELISCRRTVGLYLRIRRLGLRTNAPDTDVLVDPTCN
jgi:hypothetical protein